jgi:hypothetical protein
VLAGLDLMRSEVIQVIIPAESAQLTVSYIADLSLVQFKDVRPPPQILRLLSRASAPPPPRLAIAVPTMSSTGGEGSSPTRKVQTPRDAHLVHLLRMSSLFSLSDVPPRSFLWQGGREGGRG